MDIFLEIFCWGVRGEGVGGAVVVCVGGGVRRSLVRLSFLDVLKNRRSWFAPENDFQ